MLKMDTINDTENYPQNQACKVIKIIPYNYSIKSKFKNNNI